jgi:PGF-CTERM protein
MRTSYVTVLIAMTVLAPVAGTAGAVTPAGPATGAAVAPAPGASGSPVTEPRSTGTVQADDAPPDPETDVLGWEDGYWYNESIAVDRSDGLNDSELEAVVSRAMARVEQVRKLEFRDRVPVEIISRERYREQNAENFGNLSAAFRLHQNAKFEALFFENESTDAVDTQQSTLGATVLGFYDPQRDEIRIVSEDTDTPEMDEITLAQELFHALQGQVFDAYESETLTATTREDDNAVSAVIEGDGNYVDYLYQQRCEAEWDCLLPQSRGGGGNGSADVNVGINVLGQVPYQEGPEFVQGVYERGGWAAVNDLYENPPESTEQYIHPEKYPDESPVNVTVADRSTDAWAVLDLGNGSVNYAEFGEAGLYTMLWYPSYKRAVEIRAPATVGISYVDLFEFQSPARQSLQEIGGYNYSNPATEGYAGDKLYPYVPEQNASLDELAYVWKIQWDSPADAEEFVSTYRDVLSYYDAESVDGRADTYRVTDDRFADAFYVNVSGATVTIVNAPTVEDLSAVRSGAAPQATADPTATTTDDADGGTDTTADATDGEDTTTDTEAEPQPGFGLVVAVLAVVGAALLLRRRR